MWKVVESSWYGHSDLQARLEEALNALVPENAQRDTVQVIIPESATGHLVSGTTTVLIKFWVPEDSDNSIMISGDVVLNRAPDQEPFDHESGDQGPSSPDDEEYLGPDKIEISPNH